MVNGSAAELLSVSGLSLAGARSPPPPIVAYEDVCIPPKTTTDADVRRGFQYLPNRPYLMMVSVMRKKLKIKLEIQAECINVYNNQQVVKMGIVKIKNACRYIFQHEQKRTVFFWPTMTKFSD